LHSPFDWLPWKKLHFARLAPFQRGENVGMKRVFLASLLSVALLYISACKSKSDEREAIRRGVVQHLSSMQGLNLPNMEINVTQYSVNGAQATAQVEIRAKGAEGASGTMQLAYNLERRGAEWVVVKSAPAGGSLQHPAQGDMPPGAAMPPGHPAVNGSPGQVHSDFNEILKGAPAPSQQSPAPAPQPPPKP
jgi:hypothetical protein